MADGSKEWQRIEQGLPDAPTVRALAVHPQKPEIVYAGTQSGAYRSADNGGDASRRVASLWSRREVHPKVSS